MDGKCMKDKSKKPNFVVVFNKISEENIDVVSSLSEGKNLKNVTSMPSVMKAKSKSDGQADTTLYKRLAVATTDLKDNEISKLAEHPAVMAVVPNKIRHLPAIFPQTTLQPPVDSNAQIASYLQGVIDGASLALEFQTSMRLSHESNIEWLKSIIRHSAEKTNSANINAHSWALDLVGLNSGYQRYTGKGISVAVLDTGIDLTHPDFRGKLAQNNAISFVDNESVIDGNGHGTHCAGTIGASSNGKTRYAVAPDVELLIGKVLDNSGSGYDSDILEGIIWALERGARVISMSLGKSRSVGSDFDPLYEQLAKTLMNDENGALFVCACGNDSFRPHYTKAVGNPAACPSFLSVAAVDKNRNIAYFSDCQMDNIGEVNLSGPGVNIYSSWKLGGYNTISGTSMATPHVAGIAALFLERNPSLTPFQLWQELQQSAIPLGSINDYGSGLVQVPI